MAFEAGYKARLLVGDYSLSQWTQSISTAQAIDMLDVTVHESAPSKSFIPGLVQGTIKCSGVLDGDGASTSLIGQLDTWNTGQPEPMTFGHKGYAVGSELMMVSSDLASFEDGGTVAGINEFSLDVVGAGLATLNGVSLHDLTAETNTGTGTEYDAGASSANGAVGHLHVTAYSGFTSMAIKIQHSTTSGSSYADLITFTTATGVTSQRSTVTGTVNRYLQVVFTKVGSGSCTFQVGLSRL